EVGYIGPDACTFGYQALQKFFNHGNRVWQVKPVPVPFKDHYGICQAVGSMQIKYGVVAIENVIDGVVAETVRAIESVDSHLGVKICGEVTVPIELFYMSKNGKKEPPKRLVSHEKAIGQCSRFVSSLREKGILVGLASSTGQAAKEASENPEVAALASVLAQKTYKLQLIEDGSVVDHNNSVTRFWILGKQHAPKSESGKDKTCFLVNLEQSASGVLHKTLGVFAEHGISVLLMFPSPILGKQWEYTFLVEVSGYITDEKMDKAWNKFRELGISLQPMHFLGSYPDATSSK
ncbi:MAG: prephenate dehydratase domain-containing protein, partial [bacterium]|nr:prephenate dehydratase domain-containing protein [bacterium]